MSTCQAILTLQLIIGFMLPFSWQVILTTDDYKTHDLTLEHNVQNGNFF